MFLARSLVMAAALLSFGCWGFIPSEQAYGTYVAIYPFGTETLTLNRDGSDTQQFLTNHAPVPTHGTWGFDSKSHQGSWSFDPRSRSDIIFYDFVDIYDERTDSPNPTGRMNSLALPLQASKLSGSES